MDNEVLLITEGEVAKLLTMEEVLEAVEEAFREKVLGKVQTPLKVYVSRFDSTGLYLKDITTAAQVFEKAKKA